MHIEISNVGITFLGYASGDLFSPLDGRQSSADGGDGKQDAKLVIQDNGHFISVKPGLFYRVFAEGGKYRWSDTTSAPSTVGRSPRVSEQSNITQYISNRTVTAVSGVSHLDLCQRPTEYHVMD